MSFKLTVEIMDDSTTKIDFDGTVNHIVLLGVLESVKHGVLGTADMMAHQEMVTSASQQKEPGEQSPPDPKFTAPVAGGISGE